MWRQSASTEPSSDFALRGQPARDVVLAEDAGEDPAPRGHCGDRGVVEAVLKAAEAIRHVGRDHRDLFRRVASVQ